MYCNKFFTDELIKLAFGEKEHTLLGTGSVDMFGNAKKSTAKSLGYNAKELARGARSADEGVTHPFNPVGFNTFHTGAGSTAKAQGKTFRKNLDSAVSNYDKAMFEHLEGRDPSRFVSRAQSGQGITLHGVADIKHRQGPIEQGYATRGRKILPGYVSSGIEHVKSDFADEGAKNTTVGTIKKIVKAKMKGEDLPHGTNAIDELTGTVSDKRAVKRSEAILRTTKKKAIRKIVERGYSPAQAEEAWQAINSIQGSKKLRRSAKGRTILRTLLSKF